MAATTAATSPARIRAIDWLRGLVMILMTIDHAGTAYDAHHMHGDSAHGWTPGSALPAGEFLTRFITHVCAPAFVLLAGTSLALSSEKRRGQPGRTAFIVKRGLLIAALDPIWMSLGFALYHVVIFQVLYAIGMSL
ncbi:MAG TPA: acyltransferase family protein, partial [Polyangia bacterium]|nr:acyltransferase family protein [Polyangia bacterium]